MPISKPKKVCKKCRSDDILIVGSTRWNPKLGAWVLVEPVEQPYCGECEADTEYMTEVSISDPETEGA